MGCGCKKGSIGEVESIENNNKLTLTNIVESISLLILLVILTPLILILIWVIGVNSILNRDFKILGPLFKKYIESRKKDGEEMDEYINEDNMDEYELENVDIIK